MSKDFFLQGHPNMRESHLITSPEKMHLSVQPNGEKDLKTVVRHPAKSPLSQALLIVLLLSSDSD